MGGVTPESVLVTTLNQAPRAAAEALEVDTVLVSRVLRDGSWVPWPRQGDDPTHAPGLPPWPLTSSFINSWADPEGEFHPRVSAILAKRWITVPIYRHGQLIAFLHVAPIAGTSDDPSAPFALTGDRSRVWSLASQLGRRPRMKTSQG